MTTCNTGKGQITRFVQDKSSVNKSLTSCEMADSRSRVVSVYQRWITSPGKDYAYSCDHSAIEAAALIKDYFDDRSDEIDDDIKVIQTF